MVCNYRSYVNIYDMTTLKRRKTLHFPEDVPTPQPQAIAFTNDSKGIAVLSKEPEAFLVIFYFDKAETIVCGRVNAGSNLKVVPKYISCNLNDAGVVAVGGKSILVFLLITNC